MQLQTKVNKFNTIFFYLLRKEDLKIIWINWMQDFNLMIKVRENIFRQG